MPLREPADQVVEIPLQLRGSNVDLWKEALASIDPKDRPDVDLVQANRLDVLKDVLKLVQEKKELCMKKRWKYTKSNGDTIILRDVFEKIGIWVTRATSVFDTVFSNEPSKMAALPWACIKQILLFTTNEFEIDGAMVEGIELVSNLVGRYDIVERLYLGIGLETGDLLTKELVKLYAGTLKYLAEAVRFYARNTFSRTARNAFSTKASVVQDKMTALSSIQVEVDRALRLVEEERNQELNDVVESMDAKLTTILQEFQQPIVRISAQLSDFVDHLEETERRAVVQWISTVSYTKHHALKVKERLRDSCHWFLEKEAFIDWRKTSASSLLWLRGIPGSGKSVIVSAVIDQILRENAESQGAAPLAYFYCARRAEPERASPEEIMRSLLLQLCSTDAKTPINPLVLEAYQRKKDEDKGSNPDQLSLDETVEVILAITDENPAVIVLDALDEIEQETRFELFSALERILQESGSLLKVLVPSRDDWDITAQFENSPNVVIKTTDNSRDIERFVEEEVAKAIQTRRLLRGQVSEPLKAKIISTLISGSQGMFRWVSLQFQNLCKQQRIKVEADVVSELGRLPVGLKDSYDMIFDIISQQASTSRSITDQTLKWLLCARRLLSTRELIAAVAVDFATGVSTELDITALLDICCNLVIHDAGVDTFRLAHLSVREYLETSRGFSPYECHTAVIERCLMTYLYDPAPGAPGCCREYEGPKDCFSRVTMDHREHMEIRWKSSENSMLKWQEKALEANLSDSMGPTLNADQIAVIVETMAEIMHLGDLDDFFTHESTNDMTHSNPEKPNLVHAKIDGLPLDLTWRNIEILRFYVSRTDWTYHYRMVDQLFGDTCVCVNAKKAKLQTCIHESSWFQAVRRMFSTTGKANYLGFIFDTLVKYDFTHNSECETSERSLAFFVAGDREPLFILSAYGLSLSLRDFLIIDSVDLEQRTSTTQKTALHIATRFGHFESMRILIGFGALLDAKDIEGQTPLHEAIYYHQPAAVEILIQAGADIEARNKYQRTPLHFAVEFRRVPEARILLAHGAEVDALDDNGKSPLLHAARNNHENPELIPLLLDHGANRDLMDAKGQSVIMLYLRDQLFCERETEAEQKEYWHTLMRLLSVAQLNLLCPLSHEHIVECMPTMLDNNEAEALFRKVGVLPETEDVDEESDEPDNQLETAIDSMVFFEELYMIRFPGIDTMMAAFMEAPW